MTSDDKNRKPAATSEGVPAPEGPANVIDTEYVIGQDNITTTKFGVNLDLHGMVFTVSSLVILVFVILTLALQAEVKPLFDATFSFVTENLSWVFLLGSNLFVVVSIALIFTPLGKVRIGGAHASSLSD